MASVKLKKKSIIYKHIVIKKRAKEETVEKNEIEIQNEFPILSKYHTNPKSVSFSYGKNCEKYITWLSSKPASSRYSTLNNIRATSLEVNILAGKPDLASYLMNSRINIGKKCEFGEKNLILKKITLRALKIEEGRTAIKYFFNQPENLFNVVVFGPEAPLSDCCKVHLVVQISQEYGGKVICPHRSCVIQFISNFCIDKPDRERLWPTKTVNEHQKAKEKSTVSEFNPYEDVRNSHLFSNITTLSVPADKFSALTDPLQQLLKHHKKLSY